MLLLLPLLLVNPAATQAAEQLSAPAAVVRVVDGDTVDVQLEGKVERIRLIGIDTPEVVDPRKPVQCYGREASQHAHELLDGQSVSLEFDASQGSRDKYGRLLAYIWLPDARNFGEVMIADGYAHEYTYSRPYTYLDSFRAAQDVAMTSQVGLWSPATCAGDTRQTSGAGSANQLNCSDFTNQADAQAVLRADPSDPNGLDTDRDGIACETRPAPKDLTSVARP
jgi:endonuclease YncB( thermonuclease family)